MTLYNINYSGLSCFDWDASQGPWASAVCLWANRTFGTTTIWLQQWKNGRASPNISVNCLLLHVADFMLPLSLLTSDHVWLNFSLLLLLISLSGNIYNTVGVKMWCHNVILTHLGNWSCEVMHLWQHFNKKEGAAWTGCYCLSATCDLFSQFRKLAVKHRAFTRRAWKRSLFLCSLFKQALSWLLGPVNKEVFCQ